MQQYWGASLVEKFQSFSAIFSVTLVRHTICLHLLRQKILLYEHADQFMKIIDLLRTIFLIKPPQITQIILYFSGLREVATLRSQINISEKFAQSVLFKNFIFK
jgi:hypothetical protein